MTHPKIIFKRIKFPTIHPQLPSSKYALTRRYEFGHYRSFWKVNKNTFWVKASYMNMEDSIEMKPKWLFRGHPNISKKSKNTLLGSKLRELCIVKVGNFWKIVKSQHWSNLYFFQRGPCFLAWNMFLIGPTTPELFHLFFITFIIYFDILFN